MIHASRINPFYLEGLHIIWINYWFGRKTIHKFCGRFNGYYSYWNCSNFHKIVLNFVGLIIPAKNNCLLYLILTDFSQQYYSHQQPVPFYRGVCVCLCVCVCSTLQNLFFKLFLKKFLPSYRKTIRECFSKNRI